MKIESKQHPWIFQSIKNINRILIYSHIFKFVRTAKTKKNSLEEQKQKIESSQVVKIPKLKPQRQRTIRKRVRLTGYEVKTITQIPSFDLGPSCTLLSLCRRDLGSVWLWIHLLKRSHFEPAGFIRAKPTDLLNEQTYVTLPLRFETLTLHVEDARLRNVSAILILLKVVNRFVPVFFYKDEPNWDRIYKFVSVISRYSKNLDSL